MDNGYKIMVLNSAKSGSGIGVYAEQVNLALDNNSLFYSLVMDSKLKKEKFPGIKVNGIFPPFLSTGWVLNLKYQSFVYSKVRKQAINILESGGIVHIVDPMVDPVEFDGNQVVTFHDLFALDPENATIKSERMHFEKNVERYKQLPYILTTTDFVKKELVNAGFKQKIAKIFPYASDSFYKIEDKISIRKELGLPLDKRIVLSVSSTKKRKNTEMIPRIMKNLNSSYVLLRIGDQVGNSINFKNVDSNTLNKIYNASDILLQPSLEEGFGFPLCEAMRVGLPIVCSDIEVFHEVAGNAAYFSKIDDKSFADGIETVFQDIEAYSIKSDNRAGLFSKERFDSELNSYYSSILKS